MADSFIQLSPDSTGKKVDTEELTVNGQSVHRERMQIAGDSDVDLAPVTAADGLTVNLGTNNDVTVASLPLPAGAATLAEQQTQSTALAAVQTSVQLLDNAIAGSEMQVDVVAALPAGNNNIGDVDIASLPNEGQQNMAGSISVAIASDQSTVPVSLAAGGTTQYAEDTAHVSGDLVTMAGVVQQTADAALSSDGDRSAMQVDGSGWLKVNIKAGAGSGGTAMVDDAAFTPGTTSGTPAFALADESGTDSVDEGDAGALRMTLDRKLLTRVVGATDANRLDVDASGHAQVDIAAASVTVPVSAAALPLPSGAATEAKQDTQITHLATIAGDTTDIEAAVELIDDTVKTLGTDTYTEATTKGLLIGAVRRDANTTLVDTTNEIAPLQVNAGGQLKVDGSAVTQPVSGTVTANAGTNLNTSLLALESGGNLATAVASLSVLDDWDEADRAKVNPIAGQAGVQGASGAVTALTQRVVLATDVALPAGTNNIGDVDVITLPALVAGTANIGDVDIASAPTGSSSITVQGAAAHAAAAVGNPVYVAGRASTALPTDVGADGDAAALWVNRNGLVVVSGIPGAGLNADPYALLSVTAQYTGTQTSAVLLAGGASERIIVTSIQIQAGGTTAGTLQVYFGTGAYSRGTNSAIFDGEFAPSATLKPGFFAAPPAGFRSPTLGHDVLVTDSAAINPLTISIWYYLLGV